MRTLHLSTIALFTVAGSFATACGNDSSDGDSGVVAQEESSGPSSSTAPSGTTPSPVPSTTMSPTPAASAPTNSSEPQDEPTPTLPGDEDDSSEPDSNETPEPDSNCTDTPDPEETCQQRLEWGNCDQQWMIDGGFCNRTCGRCDSSTPSETPGGDEGPTNNEAEGDSRNVGGNGDDNPYPPIQGGQQGNSTRYWDCCKQSCGWTANASQPVSSCDYNGNNIGVNDGDRNVCDGGNATTCHGMAPWAYSSQVSYGYAAANGAPCGTCWQLQFTGSSSTTPGDPGASAIAGKTMIVMATNVGDLNGALHFDLLIPGGGLGLNNGCTTSLGIPEDELGANRGGFLTSCSGDLQGRKQCVRERCESVFGSRGLTQLEDGCLWFVDWFETADNPDFLVQQIDCPQELRAFN